VIKKEANWQGRQIETKLCNGEDKVEFNQLVGAGSVVRHVVVDAASTSKLTFPNQDHLERSPSKEDATEEKTRHHG